MTRWAMAPTRPRGVRFSGPALLSASTTSRTEAYRASGALTSARARVHSRWPLASGRWRRSGSACAVTCMVMVARELSPTNGGRPVRISYTTQARL